MQDYSKHFSHKILLTLTNLHVQYTMYVATLTLYWPLHNNCMLLHYRYAHAILYTKRLVWVAVVARVRAPCFSTAHVLRRRSTKLRVQEAHWDAWNRDLFFQKPSMWKEKSILSMMLTCYTSFADLWGLVTVSFVANSISVCIDKDEHTYILHRHEER